MGSHLGLPDWRDEDAYADLARAEASAFAWEWLRRDPGYRDAASAAGAYGRGHEPVRPSEPAAETWGLHAFENPELAAISARPMWRREWLGSVLPVSATLGGAPADRFDIERVRSLATVLREDGAERLLLSDGMSSLRVDVLSGTLLRGPVRLAYLLSGIAAAERPLQTLRELLRLWRSGRFDPAPVRSRNRRLILLLRAHDALRGGTSQRMLAEELLSRTALGPRWRSEAASLRSQAQRLARGARAMGEGGWRALLVA